MTPRTPPLLRVLVSVLLLGCCLGVSVEGLRADPTWLSFDVPEGEASATLKVFAQQAHRQIMFASDAVKAVRTPEVRGRFTAEEALGRLLSGTDLSAAEDSQTGAIAVGRAHRPEGPSGDGSLNPPLAPMKQKTLISKLRAYTAPFLISALSVTGARAQTAESAGSSSGESAVKMPQFEVSASEPDPYQTTDSSSAARVVGALLDTPSSIHATTREMMDTLGASRVIDSTRYLPGVNEGRGVGFSDRMTLRGFESNGRVVDNFSSNTAANFDAAIIDRIELLEGPSTILSPNGSPGGTLNMITKSPQFTPMTTVSATVGRYAAQEVVVDSTGPIKEGSRFAYRVVGHYQDTDLYWKPNGTESQKTLNPMLEYKASDRTTVTFKYLYLDYFTWGDPRVVIDDSVTGNAGGFAAAGFPRTDGAGNYPWNYRAAIANKADLTLNSALTDNINMRLAADWWADSEPSEVASLALPGTTNRYNPYTGILTPDSVWALNAATGQYVATNSPWYNPAAIPQQSTLTRVWNQAFTVQNDYAGAYKLPWGSTSTTVAGFAFNHNLVTNKSWVGALPTFNLSAPAYTAVPVYPANPTSSSTSQGISEQLYAMEKLGLYSDRVFLTGGASRLWVDNASANVLAKTVASTLKGYHDTYIGSVLFKLTSDLSAYYSYASNSNPVIANNITLWQDGKQQEFGLKLNLFNGRLSVTASHFQITQTNVTAPNPEYQLDHTQPQTLISNFKNHGQEFSITGGLTKDISIVASVTGLHETDALGRRPRAVSDLTAGALVEYTFHHGALTGLSADFGAQYTGDQEGDAPPNFTALGVVAQPSFLVPAYTATTAGASYKWRHYTFRLVLDNVFDSTYLYASGARFAVAESTPTNVRFTAVYKF